MLGLVTRFALNYDSLPGSKTPIDGGNLLTTTMTIVFGLAGAISVLIITLAGIQYIISSGDPQKTAKAKNTIIYAIVGLAVALLGSAFVAFVVRRIG